MLPAHITANRARSVVIETLLHEDSGLDASKIALIDRMELKGRMLTIYATDGSSHTVTLPKGVSPEALQEELDTLVKASDFERFKNAVATTMALKVDTATMNAALDSLASRLKGEPGEPGASVANVELQGDELVFTLTNGETFSTEAPRGAPGEKGEDGLDGAEGDHIVSAELRPEPEGDKIVFTTAQGVEIAMLAPKGPEGPAGPQGPEGPAGKDGAIGPKGEQGESIVGPPGPEGPRGLRGAEGPIGPKGDTGPKGDAGPQGPAGTPGKDGMSPPPPTLRVGEVTTLPATATATAEITGEAPDYTLTLGIPQGPKGDTGEALGVQDTGWREIAPLAQPPSGADPARNVFESLQVRRIGQTVMVYARFKTNAPNGWTLSSEVPGFSSPYTMDARSSGGIPVLITGQGITLGGAITNGSTVNFIRCEYTTADPWPVVLPGAPA